MLAPYVAVTVVAAIAFASASVLNFTRNKSVAETAERLGVPVSWHQPTLASRKFLMRRWVMVIERPEARVTGADPA